MENLFLDRQYISNISLRLQGFKKLRPDLWTARCPICGDSKKNKSKKRFYFHLDKRRRMRAKCHNCQYSAPFYIFLKEFDQNMFKEYTFEKFKTKKAKPPRQHLKEIIPEKEKIEPGYDYADAIDFESLPKSHPARKYVEDRKIPLELVLYAPFYGRSFDPNSKLKYITTKVDEKYPKIYGMDRVDKSRTIIVQEGPIDSMFIDNSIAMSGMINELPSGCDYIFMYDNEPRNRDVCKAMEMRLNEGHKVWIPPRTWKEKDVNDAIIKGWKSKKILDMVNKTSYNSLVGLMMFNKWKRI